MSKGWRDTAGHELQAFLTSSSLNCTTDLTCNISLLSFLSVNVFKNADAEDATLPGNMKLFFEIGGLPDNCAPYVIIYTWAQLSGSGAQLSGPGAQLSGPGAQLSAILVCIPTYVISAPLCMYRSLEAPFKTSDTIFWVAVMRWSAAFLFRELKKVDFSSMRLSGAWLCGLEPWLRALLVSR